MDNATVSDQEKENANKDGPSPIHENTDSILPDKPIDDWGAVISDGIENTPDHY